MKSIPHIIPTAEPFFYPGSGKRKKVGCLVQHGFTGTPKEMRWLGEYLNKKGYSVCGMRLTGHATKPEDMIRSRWNDWLVSVEDGYNLLRTCSEKIILIGLSMGAALSLIFASSHPVDGVVAMSTPYSLPNDPRLKFIKLISLFIKYLPKSKGDPGANWFDQDSWKQHIAYPQNPVRSIAELNQLLHVMQKSLQNVEVPVLLIHSRDDDYIIRDSMEKIYTSLGTSNKEKLWVEGGGHVITEEPTRHEIFKASADFIGRVTGL